MSSSGQRDEVATTRTDAGVAVGYSSLVAAMKFMALDALLQDLADATPAIDSVSVTITLNAGGVPVIGPKVKEYVRGGGRCRIAPSR